MQTKNKALSPREFDLLTAAFDCSLDTAALTEEEKPVYAALLSAGALNETGITEQGLQKLEPYRVRRAVIIAAGFGARLVPITLNTPKPLVRVHGKRIIDTLLDAIVAAGIEEIVIVRGYLGEQFDGLLERYPNITFVNSTLYDKANNISSVLCAKGFLKNAYVLEADLLLSNPSLIRRYEYTSNFLGIPVETSADWCFIVKNRRIQAQVSDGREWADTLSEGESLYQEVGISYWSEEDGERIGRHVEEVFQTPDGKNRYWDQVIFLDHKGEYDVTIRPCHFSDIVEIDSFHELVAIDESYAIE